MMRRQRGTSLIFVLGILALLSLFAISFATVTRVERVASANYVDEVRAKLAARAGLAAGIAGAHDGFRTPSPGIPALGGYLDSVHTITAQAGASITLGSVVGIAPGDPLTLFGGGSGGSEDVTVASGYVPGTNPVALTSNPAAGRVFALPRGGNWFYHGHSRNPVSTGNGIPLSVALTTGTGTSTGWGAPSLRVATGPTLNGSIKLVSGSTGGTYFADPAPAGAPYVSGGDVYGSKILDSAGMLDANMEQGELQAILPQFGKDVVDEVTQMSGALSPCVSSINQLMPLLDSKGAAYGTPFDSGGNVTAFFAFRDKLSGKRFRSKEQLKGAFYAMSAGDSAKAEAWFTVFRDYFTCFGDYDGNDTAGDDPQGNWNPPGGVPLLASGAPDVANIFQNKKKSQTAGASRISVNVNTAPLPVLVAVLSTVRARSLPTATEDPTAQPLTPMTINAGITPMAPYDPAKSAGTVTALTRTDALAIAKELVTSRPFRSWNEVYKCLNGIHAKSPAPVTDPALAAAIVATCPVDMPLSINPDRSLLYWDATNPDDPTPANVGFKVAAEKAGSHSCADFSFTSGYFEVEALGRIYANPTAPFVVAEATKRCVVNVGGVFWVRGERDLSASLNPAGEVMGAPAVNPDTSYVGGWIQPKPADSGIQVDGSLTSANASLNPFTPNAADGFLVERTQWTPTNSDVIVAHSDTSPASDDMGQVEMWVKQPFDCDKGTNEALFMNVRNYNQGLRHAEPGFADDPANASTISQIGVATRLERFGNKLYFCRFYWGYPDGASPAKIGEEQDAGGTATPANPTTKYIDNMHGFITSPVLNWKAGTWHHVFISWHVMSLKMFVDGQDMGASALPSDYKGGVVWENTVQGFFPDSGSGGVDPNNQFAGVTRDTTGEAQVDAAIAAAQAHQQQDTAAINAMPVGSRTPTNTTFAALKAHIQDPDQKTIDQGNAWKQGGTGHGNFAHDVQGMTFIAQLGLRRMKLRTHLPIPAVSDAQADAGITESYFLGYKTPAPYNNEAPPEIVTLEFKFGNPGATGSFYYRYCNGTYDAIKWTRPAAQNTTGPTPMPHRYRVDDTGPNGTFDVSVTFPSGWTPVAYGHHVIVAHDVFPTPDVDLFGGGQTDRLPTGNPANANMKINGQKVTITKTFPQGNAKCNVLVHDTAGNCSIPGSDEIPWCVSGAWIAYEKPTVFLEAPEVD